MKELKDMTADELVAYFIEKKQKGASYAAIAAIFEKNGIEGDTKKMIMNKLDDIDAKQKAAKITTKNSNKRNIGLGNLIVGILIIAFGFILFFTTAKEGVVFILNFAVWAFGALLVFRGIMHLIAGTVKKN